MDLFHRTGRKGQCRVVYKYTVKYKCGCIYERKSSVKPSGAMLSIDSECEKCRAKINKKQLTIEELNGIKKEIKGTEKQVAAAEKNRERFIKQWVKAASDSQADIIRDIIATENYAGWWMDHYKEVFSQELIDNYEEKYKTRKKERRSKTPTGTQVSIADLDARYKKNEILSHCIRPNILKHQEMILIEHQNSTMLIKSSAQSTPELKKIMAENECAYDDAKDMFMKDLNEFTGNYSDRAAELGIMLLDNGYVVSILNNTILNMVRKRQFVPSNDKWVKYFNSNSVFLDWKGYERILCNRALAFIDGAHWDNNFKKVIIPAKSCKQILDYAERYGFSIEKRALILMEAKRRANI